jgi:hypothetical protein
MKGIILKQVIFDLAMFQMPTCFACNLVHLLHSYPQLLLCGDINGRPGANVEFQFGFKI